MYATVQRRRMNQARAAETRHAAEADFWPKVRQAPGFVSLTLIQGDDGVNTSIILFATKADAEAFRSEAEAWAGTLDAHGHQVETRSGGEVIQHLAARADAGDDRQLRRRGRRVIETGARVDDDRRRPAGRRFG